MTGTGHTCTRYCIITRMCGRRAERGHGRGSLPLTPLPSTKKSKTQKDFCLVSQHACLSAASPPKPFSEAVGCNYGENCADGSSTRGHGCSGWRSEQTYTLPAIVGISTNTWHRHEQHAPRTSRTLTAGAYYGYVVLVPVLAPRV